MTLPAVYTPWAPSSKSLIGPCEGDSVKNDVLAELLGTPMSVNGKQCSASDML